MISSPNGGGDARERDADWASPRHIHTAFFLYATLLGSYLCYLIALPFVPSVTWAIGLAVLATPVQKWLEAKFQRPGLCALATTCLLGLVVVVPASLAIQQLASQAANGAVLVVEKLESGEWRQDFSSRPRLASAIEQLEQRLDLSEVAKMLSEAISGITMSILKNSVYQLIDLFLTFYLLFFLLRDRDAILSGLCRFSPLTGRQMSVLYNRVKDTIDATVYGSFIVAGIQGIMLGGTFWFLGLPAPFLWGLVMACLALAPVAGAVLVWGPAAGFLVLEGSWGKAIALVVLGVLAIVIVDNLLRPVLVGKRLQTHTVLVFISVVGGMIVYGPSGVLLGPIVLTVTQVLLETSRNDRV